MLEECLKRWKSVVNDSGLSGNPEKTAREMNCPQGHLTGSPTICYVPEAKATNRAVRGQPP
jgi:hypothetical protein